MAHKRVRAPAVCDQLERRRLLSVTTTLNGAGTLDLTFHAANDTATITSNATTGNRFVVSGTGLTATTFQNVSGLELTGSSAFSSSATINNQSGDPITLSQSIAINDVTTSFTVSQPVAVRGFVDSGSPITLNVAAITSSANQSFFSPVTLASDVVLTSTGNVTFGSTVNGAHALTVDNTGPASFGGAVGGVTRLTNLTIDGSGATSMGATIATSGAQQYNSAVSLTANSSVSTSAAVPRAITFLTAVDGPFSLTTNGGVQFLGPVGSAIALAGLTVNASTVRSFATEGVTTTGNQNYGGDFGLGAGNGPNAFVSTGGGNITFSGPVDGNAKPFTVNTAGITTFSGQITNISALLTDAPGTTRIGATQIIASGALTLNDAVTLTASTDLTSTGGGGITLGGTVDGAFVMLLDTSGTININRSIGLVTPLAGFGASGFGASAPSLVHITAGSTTTTGAQEYDGSVLLGVNWQANAGSPGVTFNGTVDGAFDLSVSTVGTATFAGVVGGATPLNSLTVSARLNGAGGVLIKTARITTRSFQDYANPATLGADCTLSSTTVGGTIKFENRIDGHFALTVSTVSNAEFHAAVGGSAPLSSLDIHADGGILFFAGATTSGGQTYESPLEMDTDAALTSTASGDIVFASSLDGAAGAFLTHLTLNTAGATRFNGPVGVTHTLGSLSTDAPGTTLLNGGTVSVLNAQTYADPVLLGADTTLNPGQNALGIDQGSVEFDNTVNGAHQLSVRTGNFVVNAPMGDVTPLSSLSTLGGSASLQGSITTASSQSLSELHHITLSNDLALSSVGAGPNDLSLGCPVDGAHTLTLTAGTGDIRFNNDVGGTTPLAALTIVSAHDVTGMALTAGSIAQSAGLGTTAFTTLHATDPAGISLVGKAFALDTLNIDRGSLTITDGGPASISGVMTAAGGLTKAGAGILTLAQANHYPGLTDVTGGTLEFDKSLLLPGGTTVLPGGLHIGAGATAAVGNPSLQLVSLTTASLTFDGTPTAPQGRLDLNNGNLSISFGNTPDPIAAIAAEVAAGFDHGLWDGQGIISSVVAMNPSQRAVGYGDGTDGIVANLPPGEIFLRTTVPGDVNLDGTANFNDLLALAQHFGQAGIWDEGDLNYDAAVNFADLLTLAQHFGGSTVAPASGLAKGRIATRSR